MESSSSQAAFASALSTRPDSREAGREVAEQVRRSLGASPDLAFVFFSPDHIPHGAEMASQLCADLGTDVLIGCSGESIVGTEQEIEGHPAVALWGARLPGARIIPLHLDFVRAPEGGTLAGWPADFPGEWPPNSALVALGDPFTFPVEQLLELVSDDHPGVPVLGGMASAASQPGENLLVRGQEVFTSGCVAAWVSGGVRVRALVSQGCRPIGQPFVITQAERNVIQQLGGKPAYERLIEVYRTLATSEQALVRRGLHIGRVVSEYQDHFEQGDFLVRNVVGLDEDSGAIAVGDYVRPGQTVQFQVRDAETADAELRQLLAGFKSDGPVAGGALLFTCNGRGTRLFAEPHHDAAAVAKAWGRIPLAGFFAAGELGPIGGRNFIHGFTASIALFEPL